MARKVAVDVLIPSMLHNVVGSKKLRVEASTLAEVIEAAFLECPALRFHLCEDDGKFRPHVLCFHNEDNTRDMKSLKGAVKEGDEVAFVPAISGGAGTRKPRKRPKQPAAASGKSPRPKHGDFVWHDLLTRDDERALTFFEKLVGWKHKDIPLGEGQAPFHLMRAGAKSVAGIIRLAQPSFTDDVPTHWCGYIAVRDVDASWRQVAKLGGEQIHPPSDVPGLGRFCILKDPTGAVVALITPPGGVD